MHSALSAGARGPWASRVYITSHAWHSERCSKAKWVYKSSFAGKSTLEHLACINCQKRHLAPGYAVVKSHYSEAHAAVDDVTYSLGQVGSFKALYA